jgi:AcrR family transcriptional regulator
MSAAARDLVLLDKTADERVDAARNRALLLQAARKLIAEHRADAVSMQEIASEAGVGKGTLFRRFGSKARLMMVLLEEDERSFQEAFLRGPAPLGPGATPLQRLLAYGRERLKFVHAHEALLNAADRDPRTRYGPMASLHRRHIRVLLEQAGTSGDLHAQTEALFAPLCGNYVEYELTDRGQSLEALGEAWESLARKLCGR